MAVPPTLDSILANFETGDIPTQSQFDEAWTSSYNDAKSVVEWGADGTVSNNSDAFESAMTTGSQTVLIPAGDWLLDDRQILIASNTTVICDPLANIIKTVEGTNTSWFYIRNTSNIVFDGNGATFKYQTKPTAEEQRHIFRCGGGVNVKFKNVTAADSGGDGFYVGVGTGGELSENVILDNCISENNRRQGLSIISVRNLLVTNCIFKDTDGTSPEAGIDIEPNSNTDILDDIVIQNCVMDGNSGIGVKLYLAAFTGAVDKVIGVTVSNCTARNCSVGFSANGLDLGGANKLTGAITFKDCVSINSQTSGFDILDWDADGPQVSILNPTVINPNVVASASVQYGAGISVGGTVGGPTTMIMGNVMIDSPTIIDDRTSPLIVTYFYIGDQRTTPSDLRDVSITGPMNLRGSSGTATSYVDFYGSGYIEDPTRALTFDTASSFTISASSFVKYVNSDHTSTTTLTLSDNIPVGWPDFTVNNIGPNPRRIQPGAGERIIPGGVDLYISGTFGSSITLRKISDTEWFIVAQSGTWTYEGA